MNRSNNNRNSPRKPARKKPAGFTKKSELKGWRKPKNSGEKPADEEDFRFKKPGSKGKQVNVFKEKKSDRNSGKRTDKPFDKKSDKPYGKRTEKTFSRGSDRPYERFRKEEPKPKKNKNSAQQDLNEGTSIRLNRYLSNAGVASRREADELISAGLVTINGKVVTELGSKVHHGDVVKFNGQKLSVEPKVYILMNKPKDAITTADDPEGRKTVMDIVKDDIAERIFPVGRLDRNTTGVLMLTNDGELAQRLMHPKYNIKKVYKATLDKNFKTTDLYNLANNGVTLEDGHITPDALAIPDPAKKNEVGVEIHSGKNHIIHRIFEALGYKVDKLDRALYANLDKRKLKRGEWRHLTEKELKEIKRMVHLK